VARGTQLGTLVDRLKAEARYAADPSLGQNYRGTLVRALQRHQARLWLDFDWPFLKVSRDKSLAAGQRYYDLPTDLPSERIISVQRKQDGIWVPQSGSLDYGIGAAEYSIMDSEAGVREDPVLKWEIRENDQFEVWPLPASNATTTNNIIRFWGIRKLKNLIADSDTAELDDDMLVLYSAAELLAARDQKDAKAKLDQANAIYDKLRAAGQRNKGMVTLGGGHDGAQTRRPPLVITPVWRPS
jgi:hypothetical protein